MSLPDNEADYGDHDDVEDATGDDAELSSEALVWQLLLLVNPGDEETALRQFSAFREAQADAGDDASLDPLPLVANAIDWTSGFRVDADDPATFVDAIDELVRRWNLRVDWGGDASDDDFLEANDVPSLMAVAYDRLREYGYTLWTWDTGGEGHAGWIAASGDDEAMRVIGAALAVELRPGSDAF